MFPKRCQKLEADAQKCSVKTIFWKTLQKWKESICDEVPLSEIASLQASKYYM